MIKYKKGSIIIEYIFYLIIFSAILTYIIWGFIIGFESILALNGTKGAIKWIKKHHNPNTFRYMLIIFLPMLHLVYILLELIPFLIGIENSLKSLDLDKIYKNIYFNQK